MFIMRGVVGRRLRRNEEGICLTGGDERVEIHDCALRCDATEALYGLQ